MDADPLADVAAGLYALPPDEFVAARDEAAKRARAAGDRRLAAEIGKLRRPTVGAWVINLLVRERPEPIQELLELGEALRAAQRDLRGDDLRELSVQRRAAVAGLTREAVRLARRDHRRDNLPAAEIEATFTAALADPNVAELVRAGRLTRTVTYAGFGETPRPRLRLVRGGAAGDGDPEEAGDGEAEEAGDGETEAAGAVAVAAKAPAARRRAQEARRRAEEAAAERRAEEAAAARRRAEEAAAKRRAEQAATAERKRARVAANRELLAARTELAEAEAARVQAERAVTAARRRVEKARATVDRLEAEESQA